MRKLYTTLRSETPGLVGQPFAVIIHYQREIDSFNVMMDVDLTDITYSLTPTQLQDVVETIELHCEREPVVQGAIQ